MTERRHYIPELDRGFRAEDVFEDLAIKQGWTVVKATKKQDINEHWDRKISKNGSAYLVDVKGRSRIKRHKDFDDNWVWIELRGVKDKGWLRGKADLIAFEQENRFVIIKRRELAKIVRDLYKAEAIRKITVYNPARAHYRIYSRKNRNDVLTLIESRYIERNNWDIWYKKEKPTNKLLLRDFF